jgi:hypothetical protein
MKQKGYEEVLLLKACTVLGLVGLFHSSTIVPFTIW